MSTVLFSVAPVWIPEILQSSADFEKVNHLSSWDDEYIY